MLIARDIKLPKPPSYIIVALLKYLVAFPLFMILGPFRVRGWRNVPRKGGLIILCNHLSDCDPVATQLACPRGVQFMSKSELYEMKWLGMIMNWWGNFPVKRGEPDRTSLRMASELAKSGAAVCIYPEGQISEFAKLLPLKPGAALIVRMAEVPVIVCAMNGTNRMMPYTKVIPRPALGWITVSWSEPKTFGKDASNEDILAWAEAEFRRLIPEPKE